MAPQLGRHPGFSNAETGFFQEEFAVPPPPPPFFLTLGKREQIFGLGIRQYSFKTGVLKAFSISILLVFDFFHANKAIFKRINIL